MSQKELAEMLKTSGVIKALSIEVSPPQSLPGAELTERIELNNITDDQREGVEQVPHDPFE